MKLHKYLLEVKKLLVKRDLYVTVLDNNIITVAMNKEEEDFAYFIIDESQFPGVIISIALNFYDPHTISDIMLDLFYKVPIAKGEVFYRSRNNVLYWSEDAIEYYNYENNKPLLEQLIPSNNHLN